MENADATAATTVLCEPVQSKCTWSFHRSHFVWKVTRKIPKRNGYHPNEPPAHLPQEPLKPLSVATNLGAGPVHLPENPVQETLPHADWLVYPLVKCEIPII